jgi:hypothetical protein
VRRAEVAADSRVDLAYTLVALAREDDYVVDAASPLALAARTELSAFTLHPAVLSVRELGRGGLWSHPLAHLLLAFGPPPELAPRAEIPPDLLALLPGATDEERRAALEEWMEEVRDFAHRSGFEAFLGRHAEEREAPVAAVRGALAGRAVVPLVEAYCRGPGFDRYRILPSAFARPELGYGPSLEAGRESEAYYLGGRMQTESAERILHLVVHELAHSFVNPAVEAHAGLVARRRGLFDEVAPAMRSAHYETWPVALAEQLVEAVTARLLRRELGPWVSEGVLVLADEKRGYSHVTPLARALVEHERSPEEGVGIEAFVPRGLEALARAAGKPRWYGGADGIDETRVETVLRRILRAAKREDPTLLEGWVAEGGNRNTLVYHVTRLLPREMEITPTGPDRLEGRLRTLRRWNRRDLEWIEPPTVSEEERSLVATADLGAGAPGDRRRALLRFVLEPEPPHRLLSVGIRVYDRRAANPPEEARQP